MQAKSHATKKAINDLIILLNETGAMQKIKESKMDGFFESAVNRIATTAIEDYRSNILNLSYELVNEIINE